jgi:hypothetical protein
MLGDPIVVTDAALSKEPYRPADFNYDGGTDLLDLLGILGSGTYDQGLTTPTATVPFGTVAAVPEPSGCRLVVTILTVSTWFGRRSLRPRSSRMRPS